MAGEFTKAELMDYAVTIYKEMVDGSDDQDIMDLTGLSPERFAVAKRFMLEARSEENRNKPREHVYVEYVAAQRRNINDLHELTRHLDAKTQYNALIGAIRLRSDIEDKIIAKGQEFGIIRKEAERKEIVGGVVVADMTTDELKKLLVKQVSATTALIEAHGDKGILDVMAGPMHYGDAVTTSGKPVPVIESSRPSKTEGKTAKAKTSRRSAGRVRVR